MAAALTGAAVFVFFAQMLNPEPINTVVYAFFGLSIGGGLIVAPLAAPTIIIAERRRSGPIWVFLAAGLVTGFATLGVLTYFTGWSSKGLLLVPLPTTAASLTYWLVAWHWFAPREDFDQTVEVFE